MHGAHRQSRGKAVSGGIAPLHSTLSECVEGIYQCQADEASLHFLLGLRRSLCFFSAFESQFPTWSDWRRHAVSRPSNDDLLLSLTPSLPWCHLKTTFKSAKFEALNPFTAPACKISGLKSAHMHARKQYLWWSYNKFAFNTVHFDRSPFRCSLDGGKKSLNDFEFGTFTGRFPNDSERQWKG